MTVKKHPQLPPFYFEESIWKDKSRTSPICGFDEAGRGPLAGPVTVCALILKKEPPNGLIKDSKLMTAKSREKAHLWLKENAFYHVTFVSPWQIERNNIYHATRRAIRQAWWYVASNYPSVTSRITTLIIDALPLTFEKAYAPASVKEIASPTNGEYHSLSIAAASIVAKETRDTLMREYATLFPRVGFGQHKGYGTGAHIAFLEKNNATLIHRRGFIRKWLTSHE